MAPLSSIAGSIELIVQPHSVTDLGPPAWILTYVEVKRSGKAIMSTTLSVTMDDLGEMRAQLTSVAAGKIESVCIKTMDDDFVMCAENLEAQGHIAVGFWIGEPYEFMQGFRFVAEAENVLRFVDLLDVDERRLSHPGALP